MGGDTGLKSTAGKVSIFWFTVCLHQQPAIPSVLEENHRLVNIRVLIVDDNAITGQLLHEQIVAWKNSGMASPPPELTRSIACVGPREKEILISWPSSRWRCRTWTG